MNRSRARAAVADPLDPHAHGGEKRNVTPDFFERVLAKHYVVSGDGKHGNPDPAMFEMLFSARPALDYTVHMTYGPDELSEHPQFDAAEFNSMLDRDPARLRCLRFPERGHRFLAVDG